MALPVVESFVLATISTVCIASALPLAAVGDIGDVFIRFAQPPAALDDARDLVLDAVQRNLAVQRIIAREKGQRRTLVDDDDILLPLDVGFAD